MDVVSDILKKVKLSSAVYFKTDFSAPWGMNIPKGPFAQFHIITGGSCLLKIRERSIQLLTGDIVVFPLGTSHWLADAEGSERIEGSQVVSAVMNGHSIFSGHSISTTMICGHFEFDRSMDHPFLKELPEVIHIRDAERTELPWLENISNLVIEEAGSEREGSSLIVNKLGEVLFVHTLRAFIQKNDEAKGFLAALQDHRIGKVLRSIHQAPAQNWQLSSLAKVAGMSRTSFSNCFRDLLGDTPLSYITDWRMTLAKEQLIESSMAVAGIAYIVGYQSEAAFSRVFKKISGLTPLKYRQVANVKDA